MGRIQSMGYRLVNPDKDYILKKKIYEVKLSESHPVVSDSLQPHGL